MASVEPVGTAGLRIELEEVEAALADLLLGRLAVVAAARYGEDGFWLDRERRRIPDHWHAHARPAGGFMDPSVR